MPRKVGEIIIRHAVDADLATLLRLRDEAAEWLNQKGSDQWSEAWPDLPSQFVRVRVCPYRVSIIANQCE